MVVRLELFVQNSDSIPQLRVLDIFQAVQSVLVRVKAFVDVVVEEVAVTESSPCGTVFWVERRHLFVVLDRILVITLLATKLSKLAQIVEGQ